MCCSYRRENRQTVVGVFEDQSNNINSWDDRSISQSQRNCGTCSFLRDIWCCVSRWERIRKQREPVGDALVLKASSSLLVVSDDGQPKPPCLAGVLRSCTKKPGVPQLVESIPLGGLHMSLATSLYRPLSQKPVSIHTWFVALFNLWKNRQRLVGDFTLPNYLAYERDEQDVPETVQFGPTRPTRKRTHHDMWCVKTMRARKV